MSVDGWNTILVLGGIRSGKSEFAESLVADAPSVRYVATAVGGQDDPEWLARIDRHQRRRPQAWSTEETGADPARLAATLAEAKPDETLLVDDLGGWVTVLLDPAQQPADDQATVAELAAAVRGCAARLILVSPEVGLSLVPVTPLGRAFADALGTLNQALADACDQVVLVVAGQPTRLKPAAGPGAWGAGPVASSGPDTTTQAHPTHQAPPADQVHPAGQSHPAGGAPPAGDGRLAALPQVRQLAPPAAAAAAASGPLRESPGSVPEIEPGMSLPMPDPEAGAGARDRLATLDIAGAGFGVLAKAVEFAAATQGTTVPQPWRSVRVLLLHGDYEGGSAAGDDPASSARRAAQAAAGEGALGRLAAGAGASLQVVGAPTAAAMEHGTSLDNDRVEAGLQLGWRLAEQAADEGVDALVLAACGTGGSAAAAAVLTTMAGAEPAAVLDRVVAPGGRFDDAAWMTRCAAVRDGAHRTRHHPRDARDVLIELASGEIVIATGILLGAAFRQIPTLIDGPVGVAAAIITRELAGQARHWCLLPDHGGHPGVRLAAEILDLDPLLDLRVNLGEGATALTALPLLRAAVALAATLPPYPAVADPTDQPEPQPEPEAQAAAEPGPDPAAGSA